MKQFQLSTGGRDAFHDITAQVKEAIRDADVSTGLCLVYCPHTTAGITINENADPAVPRDILFTLDRAHPWSGGYHHAEGNSAAHVKSSMLGASCQLIIQDGRAHLELTRRKYDVIISEPSNPWMAGLATLFTKEFMNLARNKLKNNGIYVQWIHSYQMDWPTFSLVGRTFSSVFPNSILVSTDPRGELGPDFLLIGFNGKKHLSSEN